MKKEKKIMKQGRRNWKKATKKLPKMSIICTGSKNYLQEPRFTRNTLTLKFVQESYTKPLYAKNQMNLKVNQKDAIIPYFLEYFQPCWITMHPNSKWKDKNFYKTDSFTVATKNSQI